MLRPSGDHAGLNAVHPAGETLRTTLPSFPRTTTLVSAAV